MSSRLADPTGLSGAWVRGNIGVREFCGTRILESGNVRARKYGSKGLLEQGIVGARECWKIWEQGNVGARAC